MSTRLPILLHYLLAGCTPPPEPAEANRLDRESYRLREEGRTAVTGPELALQQLDVMSVGVWNDRSGAGIVFDSSGGFLLPNGAMRSPDAAWVARKRWERLSEEERRKFPPLCPDPVVELMSESDRLPPLRQKMEEWMENGCRLAWLIAPELERAYVYRPGEPPRELGFTEPLSGEAVLAGFTLALERLR